VAFTCQVKDILRRFGISKGMVAAAAGGAVMFTHTPTTTRTLSGARSWSVASAIGHCLELDSERHSHSKLKTTTYDRMLPSRASPFLCCMERPRMKYTGAHKMT
jgi:hypothetical protein